MSDTTMKAKAMTTTLLNMLEVTKPDVPPGALVELLAVIAARMERTEALLEALADDVRENRAFIDNVHSIVEELQVLTYEHAETIKQWEDSDDE